MTKPLPRCFKCNEEVPPENNTRKLDCILFLLFLERIGCAVADIEGALRSDTAFLDYEWYWARYSALRLTTGVCHILPVKEGERVICVGSPSRAQYLEGQPCDPRFEYNFFKEGHFRKAYKCLIESVARLRPRLRVVG